MGRMSLLLLAWVNLVVLIILLVIMNGQYIRKLKDSFVNTFGFYLTQLSYETPIYDEQLMQANSLYPICLKLKNFDIYGERNKEFKVPDAAYLRELLQNGSMICGKEYRTLRFLKASKNRPLQQWTDGCAEGVASAKNKMLDYLQKLCTDQQHANDQNQLVLVRNRDDVSVAEAYSGSVQVDVIVDSNSRSSTTDSLDDSTHQADSIASTGQPTDKHQYGIIYTGEPKHFRQIHQSITSLLLSNSTQAIHTVEVWVNHYALPYCKRVFKRCVFVRCMVFASNLAVQTNLNLPGTRSPSKSAGNPTEPVVITGFEAKLHALLQTTLQQVLFLDADNIVTRDVSEVFRNPGYLHTGALLWPDLWGAACKDTSSIRSGHTALKEFVLYVAQFPGLSPDTHTVPDYYQYREAVGSHTSNRPQAPTTTADIHNPHIRHYAQEAETGQLVINLTRHRGLLRLALHMIQDRTFFRRIFNGDKDIFRFVFLLTGVPFHFNEALPGISVTETMKKDCLVHFHGMPDGKGSFYSTPPLFFHQLKQRDPQSFRRYLVPPLEARQKASYCVSNNKHIFGPLHNGLELYMPTYGESLTKYAEMLFNLSDAEWAKVQ